MSWWHNNSFNAYLDRFDERDGNITEHLWMVSQLLRLAAGISAGTVEVGCNRGAMS